jgi:hypothetical protein
MNPGGGHQALQVAEARDGVLGSRGKRRRDGRIAGGVGAVEEGGNREM